MSITPIEQLTYIKSIILRDKSLLTKYGLKKPRYLGAGLQGVVYGDEKYALKITPCKNEAMFTKKHLIGRRYKYFVKVYSVNKIRGHDLWAIKMELLEPSYKFTKSNKQYDIFEDHAYTAEYLLLKMGYEHGDAHYGNIMYDRKKKIFKLIDFGFVSKI